MRLSLFGAVLLASCVAGCRTVNVRVIDDATAAPIAGATVYPQYFSMIMGYPMAPRLRDAKRTDADGKAVFHTWWEYRPIGIYVNGLEHDLPSRAPKQIVLRVTAGGTRNGATSDSSARPRPSP